MDRIGDDCDSRQRRGNVIFDGTPYHSFLRRHGLTEARIEICRHVRNARNVRRDSVGIQVSARVEGKVEAKRRWSNRVNEITSQNFISFRATKNKISPRVSVHGRFTQCQRVASDRNYLLPPIVNIQTRVIYTGLRESIFFFFFFYYETQA